MKTTLLSALVLCQISAGLAAQDPSRHLHYERPLSLPVAASGQACVALDGDVFAHTRAAGAGDIRIFGRNGARESEVPFALVESAPANLESQSATPLRVVAHDGHLNFDLAMPASEYTDVSLDLVATNFVGTADVTGRSNDGHATPLGSFTIFDLSSQGLARSTVLSLPPSNYPLLHVDLRLASASGSPLGVTNSTVTGATVLPNDGGQTSYTTIASTPTIEQRGHWSTATMIVPAHVPVERALFVLKPEFHNDFLRDVTVTASPMQSGLAALGAAEGVSGHIYRVVRSALASMPPIDSQVLSINTVIGSNLRAPAKVTATIENGQSQPLPVERVDLQMYKRTLCFQAQRGTSYALFYGDADLSGPSYSYARRFVPAAAPMPAALGPEQPNPAYISRNAEHDDRESGRDLPWLLAMAALIAAGVTALQFVRHRQEGPR